MSRVNSRGILFAAVFLSALSLVFNLPSALKLISGLIQVFILPGLVFFFFLGDRKRPLTDSIFITPLISPVLFTIVTLLITQLTPGLIIPARLSAGLFYLLLAAAVVLKKADFGSKDHNLPRSVILLSCSYGSLIALIYILNSFLLIRSDAWYHASVVNQIITGGIPPLEPWLADQPIRYMWIYHLFIASWKTLSGIGLFAGLGIFNIVSALSLPYLLARVVSFFTSDRRRLFFSTLIATAGLESVSWIMFPVSLARAFTGEVRGFTEIKRIIDGMDFTGQGVLKTLAPFGTWMVNLSDKYITITSFSYSLNLFLLCFVIFMSREFLAERRAGSAISIFLVSLGAYLFHLIAGTALICALAGSAIIMLIIKYFRKSEEDLVTLVIPSFMAVLVFALTLPYFLSLGGAESEGGSFLSEHLHLGLKNLATILLPLIILFCPARRALGKLFGFAGREYALLAAWVIPLLVLNLVADLPTRSESKLVFPLFLLLGPVIGVAMTGIIRESERIRKKLLIAWTVLLFAIPPLLTYQAFLFSGPASEASDETNREIMEDRYGAYRHGAELFEMIKNRTGEDAVVAERDFTHLAPVLGMRRNLAARIKFHKVYGYDREKVIEYHDLNRNLFGREPLSNRTINFLEKTDLDLYFLLLAGDLDENPGLGQKFEQREDLFKPVFSHEMGRLYTLRRSGLEGQE
ncbi:MAG: hypothetical protein GF417_10595 [Candidatus Latescibacteria bacterium]|nr:hypothetical protein [bacterium]MBD3424875.1 hypothetical protein [Candidatus Latescibacterota bacterium]